MKIAKPIVTLTIFGICMALYQTTSDAFVRLLFGPAAAIGIGERALGFTIAGMVALVLSKILVKRLTKEEAPN